jgi:hypothetical protein
VVAIWAQLVRLVPYAAIALGAIMLPIWWSTFDSNWVNSSQGTPNVRFELAAFTGTIAIVLIALIEHRRLIGRRLGWEQLVLMLVPGMTFILVLTYLSEYSVMKHWDYKCYEVAADQIQQGHNPYQPYQQEPFIYGVTQHYLYPPLTAQVMAKAYDWVEGFPVLTGWHHRRDQKYFRLSPELSAKRAIWDSVFYYFRCAQSLLVVAIFYLSVWFAQVLRFPRAQACLLAAGLILLNNAVFRTLFWNQLNLWLVAIGMLAVLLARRAGAISGLAIAIGGHIKLYPLILFGVFAFARYWLASASVLVGFTGRG